MPRTVSARVRNRVRESLTGAVLSGERKFLYSLRKTDEMALDEIVKPANLPRGDMHLRRRNAAMLFTEHPCEHPARGNWQPLDPVTLDAEAGLLTYDPGVAVEELDAQDDERGVVHGALDLSAAGRRNVDDEDEDFDDFDYADDDDDDVDDEFEDDDFDDDFDDDDDDDFEEGSDED